MSSQVSKASGLREVCRYHKLDISQVIALGDSDNDACMLKAAGVWVCMKNGTETARQAADFLTGGNDEDGWSRFLDGYLK